MDNLNKTERSPQWELRRQIGFAKSMKERIQRNADAKAAEYDTKIAELEAQLESLN